MSLEARRLSCGVGASLLAPALIMLAAVPAAHADTISPGKTAPAVRGR
jgi:hypothetical protein